MSRVPVCICVSVANWSRYIDYSSKLNKTSKARKRLFGVTVALRFVLSYKSDPPELPLFRGSRITWRIYPRYSLFAGISCTPCNSINHGCRFLGQYLKYPIKDRCPHCQLSTVPINDKEPGNWRRNRIILLSGKEIKKTSEGPLTYFEKASGQKCAIATPPLPRTGG